MTFEKQLRETKKKRKAAEKRENRRQQKQEPTERPASDVGSDDDSRPLGDQSLQ